MGCAISTPTRRARAAEQQAFGQQRAAQRAGAGAQRRADGQFAFAADGARENQVGDVGAGDDEDQAGRGEQHQQHGPRAGRNLVAQAHGVDAEIAVRRIGFGMLLHHGGVDRAQLGAGLFERRAGGEAAEQLGHAMDAAGDHGGREMMRAGDDVGDDLGFGRIGHATVPARRRWWRSERRCCRAGRFCRARRDRF